MIYFDQIFQDQVGMKIMKKKLLGVCFCLLAAVSTGMAAADYDSVLFWGNVNEGSDLFESTMNYLGIDVSMFTGSTSKDPGWFAATEGWDPIAESDYYIPVWSHIILYSSTSGEWYLFADDYNVATLDLVADGLLTTPEQGFQIDGWVFNLSGSLFDNVWAVDVNSNVPTIPELGSLLLLSSGIIGLFLAARRGITSVQVRNGGSVRC